MLNICIHIPSTCSLGRELLLIPVYCSLLTLYSVIVSLLLLMSLICINCLYIMFYVGNLSASEHLLDISSINLVFNNNNNLLTIQAPIDNHVAI